MNQCITALSDLTNEIQNYIIPDRSEIFKWFLVGDANATSNVWDLYRKSAKKI